MQIKLNITSDVVSGAIDRPAAARPTGPVHDREAFDNLDALRNEMDAIPVVRPEAVARGQELLSAVQYPPDKTIQSIANLLAMKLDRKQD
jgi:hypothetical protein